jgi:hypothetical protein
VVKIHFAHIHPEPNRGPYFDDYYRKHRRLPEYLKPSKIEYTILSESPDSWDSIMSSKKDLLVERLNMLYQALQERKFIKEEITDRISKDMTSCQNHIWAIEDTSYFRLQEEWQRRKFDLQREERQERAAYFRDVNMIQKELRDTMIEYHKEKQMEDLM